MPWSPGTFSAWGMLQTDMRHDVVQSFYRPLAELAGRARSQAPSRAARRRAAALLEAEGIGAAPTGTSPARPTCATSARSTRSTSTSVDATISLEQIDASFHDAHRVRYGHSTPGAPVEFVNLRLAAMGRIADGGDRTRRRTGERRPALLGTRTVVVRRRRARDAVLIRDRLPAGAERYRGPGRDRGGELDDRRPARAHVARARRASATS